ncbi:zinc finger protein schnurri isoform X2 [Arctopsyche grandis]
MHTIDSDIQNDNAVSASENRPREEFHTINNNNNDSKYLHKKFKKMASTAQSTVSQGDHSLNYTPQPFAYTQSSSQLSSCQEPPPSKRLEQPTSNTHHNNSRLKHDPATNNSECESNVQINHKDYLSDSVTSVAKDNVKISVSNDYATNHEVCETNSKESANVPGNGRHVCPYCKLSCAKPSVLQKHIRAHTNERPYPCVPCGFAFKTKSNLYKHCRSRSHALRLHGSEETPNNEEDWSLGSETDANVSRSDSTWSSDKTSVQGDSLVLNENSASDLISSDCVTSSTTTNSQLDSKPKSIYKPKFHKASFYQDEDDSVHKIPCTSPEFLNRHISKIISDNEAIVDTIDTPLHRKYSKDNSSQKQIINENSTSAANHIQDSHKGDNQPLNLTKNSETTSETNHRKRCYSESFALPESLKVPQHPLNPEGSIIKDLLLKARAQATGLLPVTSETYDASDTLYICPLCQISFKSTDNLEIHRLYYCKGISTTNTNLMLNGIISNAGINKPEPIFTRSNSVHVTLPETYNPNTLAKLASSTLKAPLRRVNKPENLTILKHEPMEVAAPLPSPGPLLGNTRLVDTQCASEGMRQPLSYLAEDRPTRSSPMLNRRSDSQSNDSKISDDSFQRSDMYSPPTKKRCTETPATLRSLEELSLSPMRQNSLQMFGGEVKILDNAGGTTTMRIEPTSQQSPTLISQTRMSPQLQGPETSSVLVRSGLHSGATIVHNPPTPKEPLPSPHPQTPRLLVSIAPNLTSTHLSVSGIPAPSMSKFQFPIGAITAYNPLTLPPLSPVASPGVASTILHCGKLIPYVPGMPGPNTMNAYSPSSQRHNLRIPSPMDPESIRHEHNLKDKFKINGSDVDIITKLNHRIMNSNNIHISAVDKKDSASKFTEPTHNMNHALKSPVPMIKINFEYNNTKQSSNMPIALSKKITQRKIDEILRKNSEILQRTLTSNGETKVVKNDLKVFSPVKNIDKISEATLALLKSSEKEKRLSTPVEMKQFNFENLISKSEILNKQMEPASEASTSLCKSMPEDSLAKAQERSETSYFKKCTSTTTVITTTTAKCDSLKFLRPSSLPLKPGTFTPKRHHGITPNANTLPLISPETPRPAKAYGQLYLNGHAYTYLGLKCSTKVYYCTLNRPQPTYVPNQHALSMYSNWQVCSESTPHLLGLTPGKAISHYDSRHRPQNYTVAKIKQDHLMTHSSRWTVSVSKQVSTQSDGDGNEESKGSNSELASSYKNSKSLTGGFESNEEYTYVRGRGRGRYVCSECGIRCKKPSMLKKHIRTHTDVRPFTCKHCAFSFKTKGNLTKHMKSKAHYRKCSELGISPLEGIDSADMSSGLGESDEDSDTDDDGNEGETESSDTDSCKSRLEHEAAHCLLSLSGGRPAPGLVSTARPTTYPYTPCTTEPMPMSDDSKYLDVVTSPHKDFASSVIRKQSSVQYLKSPGQQSAPTNCPIDLSKPMDLSKGDLKENNRRNERTWVLYPGEDILTPVGEPDILASLASLTAAKLPHRSNDWNKDEPMLQAYLTEKALQDSRIKQCQYTIARHRQHDVDLNSTFSTSMKMSSSDSSHIYTQSTIKDVPVIITSSTNLDDSMQNNDNSRIQTLAEIAANSVRLKTPPTSNVEKKSNLASDKPTSNENAKFVASEYLKVVSGKSNNENSEPHLNNNKEKSNNDSGTLIHNNDENALSEKESDGQKISSELMGLARKVVVGAGGVGFKLTTPSSEFASMASFSKGHLTEDGRSVCVVCNKTFSKPSQLLLHINIHYIERPFRCSACAVSFRTRGHLQKHERSGSHHNKVSMTSTFGAATTTNPRPFKCSDCKIAFRIHGHLAKHLRSKMHVMRLECLGKLPFGTFAEIERAGVSLTDIDTTDCDNSLASLQFLAQKLHENDPSKLDKWDPVTMTPPILPPGAESSDEEPGSPQTQAHYLGESEPKTVNDSDSPDETNVKYSATNT